MVGGCDHGYLGRYEIISASRRTDIPAFYSRWFMKSIKRGYFCFINPFNRKQVQKISLRPEDVKVIVFWTRNPLPLIPHLDELDRAGYRYYFHYTVLNYPRSFDRFVPSLERTVEVFRRLSDRIGKERIILRYDPIILTDEMDAEFHMKNFEKIITKLGDYAGRVVISFLDLYRKTKENLGKAGVKLVKKFDLNDPSMSKMMETIVDVSKSKNLEIVSCATETNLEVFGIKRGKCIDDELIWRLFKIKVNSEKDENQRKFCGCVKSKDVGMYDTCLHGCVYCYAVSSHERALRNYRKHDPDSPFLLNPEFT